MKFALVLIVLAIAMFAVAPITDVQAWPNQNGGPPTGSYTTSNGTVIDVHADGTFTWTNGLTVTTMGPRVNHYSPPWGDNWGWYLTAHKDPDIIGTTFSIKIRTNPNAPPGYIYEIRANLSDGSSSIVESGTFG